MDRWTSEMEALFADLCRVPRRVARRSGFRPRLDVYRTEEPPAITVVVELAGVDPASVELAVADGSLVIAGVRRREGRRRRLYQHMELDYGPFERRVPLSEPVDSKSAEATYAGGLLTIVLPVAERDRRQIKVEIKARRAG